VSEMGSTTIRFWSKVNKQGPLKPGMDEHCWVWLGALTDGYGNFDGTGAHRVSYAMRKGDVGEGLDIHHRCYTRSCVNPEHLAALTKTEHSRIHAADAEKMVEREGSERSPRTKSRVGLLLAQGKNQEARSLILTTARGCEGESCAALDSDVYTRLGVHRQSFWRYVKRLHLRDSLEEIYTQAIYADFFDRGFTDKPLG